MSRFFRLFLILAVLAGVLAMPLAAGASPASADTGDSLYIGDLLDNSVKRFDPQTGAYLGAFVAPGTTASPYPNGLDSPQGMFFTEGSLYLANQNADQDFNGEVLQYDGSTGQFLAGLVPCNQPFGRPCSPDAPFAPRGILAGLGHTLYVADVAGGKVSQFDTKTGALVGSLDTTGFTGDFFPRAMVFGPDGRLYLSVRGDQAHGDVGYILRFDPHTNKFIDVFASYQRTSDCAAGLHRPEGLVFGPDGNLYVTAFTNHTDDPSDTDKVLIFNPQTGACTGQINLDQAGGPRAYAQALLFGPGGYLFIPITGNDPAYTGSVRRYDVSQSSYPYITLVAAGGALGIGEYLTFRETNPRTLAYGQ